MSERTRLGSSLGSNHRQDHEHEINVFFAHFPEEVVGNCSTKDFSGKATGNQTIGLLIPLLIEENNLFSNQMYCTDVHFGSARLKTAYSQELKTLRCCLYITFPSLNPILYLLAQKKVTNIQNTEYALVCFHFLNWKIHTHTWSQHALGAADAESKLASYFCDCDDRFLCRSMCWRRLWHNAGALRSVACCEEKLASWGGTEPQAFVSLWACVYGSQVVFGTVGRSTGLWIQP